MKTLSIRITDECNYRCNFCVRGETLGAGCQDSGDLIAEVRDVLSKNAPKTVILTGGEPLLDLPVLQEVLREVVTAGTPGTQVILTTNGTKLTPRVAQWLNANRVSVILSLQSVTGGEKSFDALLAEGNRGGELLSALRILRDVTMRKVIGPSENFALDAFLLRQVLGRPVQLILDFTRLHAMSIADVYHIGAELQKLSDFSADYKTWLQFFGALGEEECDCHDSYVLSPAGELYSKGSVYEPGAIVKGCGVYADRMGSSLYEVLVDTIACFLA